MYLSVFSAYCKTSNTTESRDTVPAATVQEESIAVPTTTATEVGTTEEEKTHHSVTGTDDTEEAATTSSKMTEPAADAATTTTKPAAPTTAANGKLNEQINDSLCHICMDSLIDCILLECGHMVTCAQCGKRLADCPICRQYIVRVVRVFRS